LAGTGIRGGHARRGKGCKRPQGIAPRAEDAQFVALRIDEDLPGGVALADVDPERAQRQRPLDLAALDSRSPSSPEGMRSGWTRFLT
jgi:hypothetical protein